MPPKEETKYEPIVMVTNQTAVTATERIELTHGMVIDEKLAERLGPGKVGALRATRSAIPKAEYDTGDWAKPNLGDRVIVDTPADKATVESATGGDPKKPGARTGQTTKGEEWKATLVTELDVNPHARDSLTKAGLKTVDDVLVYGAEHNGLTDLEGIGEASEADIKKAIAKLQK